VLDAIGKAKITELWRGTLNEIGPAAFDEALKQVLLCSSFHPTIGEIRKAAGINRGVQDPTEQEALRELRKIFELMRTKHTEKLRPILGAILRDGKNEQGQVMQIPDREPSTPVPLEARTEAAIAEMGYGSRIAGLEMIAGHPAISKECDERFRVKTATEIEKRWIQAYVGVR
jgi:hypothetical protein